MKHLRFRMAAALALAASAARPVLADAQVATFDVLLEVSEQQVEQSLGD